MTVFLRDGIFHQERDGILHAGDGIFGRIDCAQAYTPTPHIRKGKIGPESGGFLIFTCRIRKLRNSQSLHFFLI